MHGSINHQVNLVFTKSGIFQPGQSKHEAKQTAREELARQGLSATSDKLAEKTAIYSYGTAEKYKDTWHDLAHYAKQEYGLKDITKLESEHIKGYLEQRIAEGIKYSSFQRECAAISKFEQALNKFAQEVGDKYGASKSEFSFREAIESTREIAKETLSRDLRDRGFENAREVIANITREESKIAASIQYEGGARISEACYIKENQLKGYTIDKATGQEVGKIYLDNTKGGKERELLISKETYQKLENYIKENGEFKISKNTYSHDVNLATRQAGERATDTHSFRYCYAQERYSTYLEAGYTHEQALQSVSWEMGHERADITLHYLR
jgi:integrase